MLEFALVTPLVCMLIFNMIYGGIMFMDYFNFSNHARAVAREVSLSMPEERTDKYIASYNYDKKAGIYLVSQKTEVDDEKVTVTVKFDKNGSGMFTRVVPESFTINYTMKLENPTGEADS